MEKKLTDEEIVKALDVCYTFKGCTNECPYFNKNGRNFCVEDKSFYKDLKDLIRRLQGENEKLTAFKNEAISMSLYGKGRKDGEDVAKMELEQQKAEIERLTSLYDGKSGFMTSSIGDLPLTVDGLRKAVDEIARLYRVQAELQDLNAKYYNEAKDLRRKLNNDGAIYSRLELDGFIDKARKETAEKFAEMAKAKAIKARVNIDDHPRNDSFIFLSDIDEIAKEITEGK